MYIQYYTSQLGNIMKKYTLLIALLTTSIINASDYLITLDSKHYDDSVQVKEYIDTSKPVVPQYNLNNVSTVDYNGNISYSRGCQCYTFFDESLTDGWSYMEFTLSNSYNVAASAGIAVNNSMQSHYYGSNGSNFRNGDRISILVKLPEGKIWFAKNGSWTTGNPKDYLDDIGTGNPNGNITVSEGDNVTFATFSGTNSTTTYYNIYNNKAGREFIHLESLGLID
jgi:hypothetical protein